MALPSLFADILPGLEGVDDVDDIEGWMASDLADELRDPIGAGLFDLGEELDIDDVDGIDGVDGVDGGDGGDEVDDILAGGSIHAPVAFGRREETRRVRRQLQGKGEAAEAWEAGYDQALRDHGLPPRPAGAGRYGGIWSDVASGVLSGATGGKGLEDVAREITVGTKEGLASGDTSQWRIARWLRGASGPASVEIEGDSLPPTYVADPAGLDAELARALKVEQSDLLQAEESFGACARYGFLGPQRRERTAEAARKAATASAERLRATSFGVEQPFIEDAEAAPVLFGDGTLWDVVYGQLDVVPCPSCSRARRPGDCVACGDHGAILVPSSDLEAYAALSQGRLVRFGGEGQDLFSASGGSTRALVPQQLWVSKVP